MNGLYDYLLKNKINKISDHELSRWPRSDSEKLIAQKLLKKAENTNYIYCDGCDDSCPIEDYEIIDIPDKGKMAAFVCPEKEEMGFITAPLSRRRYWLFVRPKRATSKPKTVNNEDLNSEPPDIEKSCFVYLPDGIAFFYDNELKKLPFQPNSQVLNILPKFVEGSMTSKEIQQYAQSGDKPRFIVKNINKSILSRLHKSGLTHISNDKFVYFNDVTNSYTIKPKIISQQQYKDLLHVMQK